MKDHFSQIRKNAPKIRIGIRVISGQLVGILLIKNNFLNYWMRVHFKP